jgi:NADH:ubiquinone oxidoreductase subunit H
MWLRGKTPERKVYIGRSSNPLPLSKHLPYVKLRALRSAAQMVSYEVSIGLILIVRLVSTFGSAKTIARIFP